MEHEDNDPRRNNHDNENLIDDNGVDTVEEMRARLNIMKQLMREKNNSAANILNAEVPLTMRRAAGIIDNSFLSIVFIFVLLVIICVSTYGFYNLFNAIVKRYGSRHDEL